MTMMLMHTFCLLFFFHSVLFVYSHSLPKTSSSSSMSILTMGYQDNNGTTVAHFQYHASPVDLDDVDVNNPPHKHHHHHHRGSGGGLTDRVKKTWQDVRLALKEDSVRLVSGTRQPLSLQQYYQSLRLAKEKKDVSSCPKGTLTCPRGQLSQPEGISSSLPTTADDLSSESLRPIVVDGTHSKTAAKLLSIRGGAGKSGTMIKGAKPKGLLTKGREVYKQIPLINRYYLTIILFCTAIHMIGLPAPDLFSLNASRFFELWRYFTSAAYFGAPSMSMANSIYFLIRYGQTIEESEGSGSYAYYLVVQIALLSTMAMLLGFPFTAQAMITAIIYMCSRQKPMDPVPFQFGFTITSWQLPFALMIIDCLSQQSAGAAWPHVLGILSAHIYHFFHTVWPMLGGKKRFVTPKFFINRFGDKPKSNVPGFNEPKKEEKKKVVKKGKAKKLV